MGKQRGHYFLNTLKLLFSLPSHSPVITSSPSEDHTYSAGGSTGNRSNSNSDNNSNGTSSDAAYESSDER